MCRRTSSPRSAATSSGSRGTSRTTSAELPPAHLHCGRTCRRRSYPARSDRSGRSPVGAQQPGSPELVSGIPERDRSPGGLCVDSDRVSPSAPGSDIPGSSGRNDPDPFVPASRRSTGFRRERVKGSAVRKPGRRQAGGKPAPSNRSKAGNEFLEWGKSLAIAIVLFLVIRTFLVQAYTIPSGSMEDTLLVGDYLMANNAIYGAQIPFTKI